MFKAGSCWLATMAALAFFPAEAPGVHLRGRIIHVGFPGSGADQFSQGADYYRVGHWVPIRVELTNDDGDLFNGWIEVRQADRDGDEIVARQDVSVRGTRRDYLYVPGATSRSTDQFNVRVFDENGKLAPLYDDQNERIAELRPPREAIAPVPNEARVILDISERYLGRLKEVVEDERISRDLLSVRSSPMDLPDNVAGLDMADVIIWDGADPTLIDLPQREALLEWTRRGGRLILGVSKNWLVVSKSRFGEVLPARLTGVASTRTIRALPGELRELLFADRDAVVDVGLTYCPVTQETLAPGVSSVVPVDPDPGDLLFVTRRPFGRGEMVLVAVEMRELFTYATRKGPFLRQLLAVRTKARESDDHYYYGETDLFKYPERLTAFRVTASLYFLFAFAFAIAYIAVATAGSWAWLKHKGMVRHTWTAFALVAVLASGVSLASVQLVRGIGQQVEEFTIVDGEAGSFDASAVCYFGLKTASHTLLDLCVPTNWLDPEDSPEAPAALRPLPPDDNAFEENVYSAGQRYQAVPILGELRSVPLRATLKQFEAAWHGSMNGRLQASLRRSGRASLELHTDSWIENDLGTALDNCYLLVANRSFMEHRPHRFNEIQVYPIGELAEGERKGIRAVLSEIAQENKRRKRSRRTSDQAAEEVRPPVLREIQSEWLDDFSSRRYQAFGGEEERIEINTETLTSALLLLTTFEEIDTTDLAERNSTVRRSQGQRLDRTLQLTKETALFVGFSRDAGPARLCSRKPGSSSSDWEPTHPSRARVMYRIAVPIRPE